MTIESINGKPFDKDATYAVITNDFLAAGGDIYYAFAAASSQIESGLSLDTVVMDYITDEQGPVRRASGPHDHHPAGEDG